MKSSPKILFFSPATEGGLAEYAFYQGAALAAQGAQVTSLVAPGYLRGRATPFEKIECLHAPAALTGSRVARKFKMTWALLADQWRLARQVWRRRPDLVLLDSYVEYLSPFWVWAHLLLARFCGVRYAANLHDPVRSYRVGPAWWHDLSVRMAYWPLDFVLVHDQPGEPSSVPARVRVAQVPHGLFEIRGTPPNRAAVRQEWGVLDGQKVFLAFGFVRDGKNLDLAVRALARMPEVMLVVAGSVASAGDRPFAFYRELADELGVAGRCRLFEGFVADGDVGKYFAGADFVLLTYASTFHSQSGVLNLAARARKPVLASAAPSPLIESVKQFSLGVAVAPDSADSVVEGMQQLWRNPPASRWEDYEAASAWGENARRVLQAAGLIGTSPAGSVPAGAESKLSRPSAGRIFPTRTTNQK